MLCCPLSRLKRTGARSVWSNWTKSNVRQTDKQLSDERGQGNKHSLDFITMMEWSLGKDSRLIFCCVYTSKSKLINTHCVVGTIGEETLVAFAIYSELERTFCKVSIAWQTLSDKAGQLTKCTGH